MRLMSWPWLEPATPNEPKATRFPSTRINVSFGSSPRKLICTVPSPPSADVHVNGAARFLRKKRLQVLCVANAQFREVCRAIRVNWVWARLFCCGNIRTGDYHSLDLCNVGSCRLLSK